MFKNLTFFFLLFVFAVDLQAMRLIPFVHSMSLDDGEYAVNYELTNKMDHPVAFEIQIYQRKLDNNGYELQIGKNDKETESFEVCPPWGGVIIPAQSSRRIMIKWKDVNTKLTKEKAYRVVFSQHTIDFTKKKKKSEHASLEIRFKIVASLYVTPKNAKSNLVVDSVTSSGKNYIIAMKNNGTKRAILGKMDHIKVMINSCEYFLKDILNDRDLESAILADQTKNLIVSSEQLSKAIKTPAALGTKADKQAIATQKSNKDDKENTTYQKSPGVQSKNSRYFDKNFHLAAE